MGSKCGTILDQHNQPSTQERSSQVLSEHTPYLYTPYLYLIDRAIDDAVLLSCEARLAGRDPLVSCVCVCLTRLTFREERRQSDPVLVLKSQRHGNVLTPGDQYDPGCRGRDVGAP